MKYKSRLEINLENLKNNFEYLMSACPSGTKSMVMVKANSYGAGPEFTMALEEIGADWLGVAVIDEALELRKKGVKLPIMVMLPDFENLDDYFHYDIEPEVYNLKALKTLERRAAGRDIKIHLKLDSGMNRLGFEVEDLIEVSDLIKSSQNLKVVSVFSHMAASDQPEHDDFTREQARVLKEWYAGFCDNTGLKPLLHLCNTSGILRFPEYHFSMVRMGIGLHGISVAQDFLPNLKPVESLIAKIEHINFVEEPETVGYHRKGMVRGIRKIATIGMGYADGLRRNLSNGNGEVLVKGHRVKIVGNVNMDMTMLDVTGIEVSIGDEVMIFGLGLPLDEHAKMVGTISYEVLTLIGTRVQRVYVK